MSSQQFTINGSRLRCETQDFPFQVKSFPRSYDVSIINDYESYLRTLAQADMLIIDSNISNLYPIKDNRLNVYSIEATEQNKNMDSVLEIIDSFIDNGISKGSKVVAIGGGIIQDLAATACALFRRCQPFIYLPTTTLGQLDSCVGGKCAVNTNKAKNILGLFSAPSQVLLPTFMINSISLPDHRAGLAEMLRLCATCSAEAVFDYVQLFDSIKYPDQMCMASYLKALALSLSIKRTVVEYDEYERDVRRSMNYGHTFGHALEKLVNFQIPHGLAVLIGMHMSNTYAYRSSLMELETYDKLSSAIKLTLTSANINLSSFADVTPQLIIDQFRYDKKGDGSSVPLILLKEPGEMIFHRFTFSSDTSLLVKSVETATSDVISWVNQTN